MLKVINFSGSFYNSPGPDATGTYLGSLFVAADSGHAHHFQVWQPAPSCLVMGVGNVIADHRPLAA